MLLIPYIIQKVHQFNCVCHKCFEIVISSSIRKRVDNNGPSGGQRRINIVIFDFSQEIGARKNIQIGQSEKRSFFLLELC